MSGLRLFLALALPQAYQDGLARLLRDPLWRGPAKLSLTRPGNWHLTLKFLGDTPSQAVPGITRALSAVDFEPFELKAQGCGFFPGQARPRVIWLGLEKGGADCRALVRQIDSALQPLGIAPQERPFVAHLTLARLRRSGRGEDFLELAEKINSTSWEGFCADSFGLWQSQLPGSGGAGPRYELLASFAARGRG